MLYLVATPIGNLDDISLRAIKVLQSVDLVLAEDTRVSGFLLSHLQIKKPLKPFFDHSEAKLVPAIIDQLKQGKNIALVSSAGMPTISDPGYKLVRECRTCGVEVTAVPGACSLINALSLSSLPHDKFVFIGFFPRKDNDRRRVLEQVKEFNGAIVYLESPFRVIKSLEFVKDVLNDPRVCVCREMTKKFEQVWEGQAQDALAYFTQHPPKGEFVVVVDNHKK